MELWKILLAAWSPFILILISAILGYNPLHYLNKIGENKATIKDAGVLTQIQEAVKGEFAKSHTKYSYLQQRRVDVIEQMYEKLWVLHKDTEAYISFGNAIGPAIGEGVMQVWKNNLEKSSQAFYDFYYRKKIFFTSELNNDMESLITKFKNSEFNFTSYRLQIEEGKDGMIMKTAPVKWGYENQINEAKEAKKEVVRVVREELPKDVQAIMDKFQDLIGVIESKKL